MVTRNAASMGTYGSSWDVRGYCGHAPTASQVDRHKGRPAIIAGGALGVFEEVKKATVLLSQPGQEQDLLVFAANDVGMFLPIVSHWVSLHASNLVAWKAVRWLHPRSYETTEYHTLGAHPGIQWNWEGLTPCFPLSGYFAMQLAWIMGCAPIVLCGCPGDATIRFFDYEERSPATAWDKDGVKEMVINEMDRLPDFKASVRSMSGWTRDFFGGM